ncbi:30S ribosomal protein S4 [Candidatus Woesearchaeota archaeon]|nr:30S ribosomal protein S4 [Candidatus Woesearchaeota archaeon]
MGDPRRLKAKYSGPRHPWNKTRIDEEKKLIQEYGLKNKKEIYKINSKLKNYASQAKKLIAAKGKQAELEKAQLITKLSKLGLISKTAHLDDVLSLHTQNLLERRLQTIIYKKGQSRTIKQARQFITHGHVKINNKQIKVPSYLVTQSEETNIQFLEKSTLSNPEHPERNFEKTKITEPKKAEKKTVKKRKTRKKIIKK